MEGMKEKAWNGVSGDGCSGHTSWVCSKAEDYE